MALLSDFLGKIPKATRMTLCCFRHCALVYQSWRRRLINNIHCLTPGSLYINMFVQEVHVIVLTLQGEFAGSDTSIGKYTMQGDSLAHFLR